MRSLINRNSRVSTSLKSLLQSGMIVKVYNADDVVVEDDGIHNLSFEMLGSIVANSNTDIVWSRYS